MYDPTLRKLAHRIAAAHGIRLREGVYVALSGPFFESPAEVRALRILGGDTVGMSTAHEALVAYHAGMRILGFSIITNLSLDSNETQVDVSHDEVLRMGQTVVPRLATIIRGVLRDLPPYEPDSRENHPEQ
jgi:purine-nucleoside phosphorylase